MNEESVVPISLSEPSLLTPIVLPPASLHEFTPFGDSVWSFDLLAKTVTLPFVDAVRICRYDSSPPSGVILGKCWRRHRGGENLLGTYWAEEPDDKSSILIKWFSLMPTDDCWSMIRMLDHLNQSNSSGNYNRSFFLPWQLRKGDACGNWEFWKGPNSPRG